MRRSTRASRRSARPLRDRRREGHPRPARPHRGPRRRHRQGQPPLLGARAPSSGKTEVKHASDRAHHRARVRARRQLAPGRRRQGRTCRPGSGCASGTKTTDLSLVQAHDFPSQGDGDPGHRPLAARQELRHRGRRRLPGAPPPDLGAHAADASRPPARSVDSVLITPKSDGDHRRARPTASSLRFDISNPHPEVSWRALFGKVWYEGYAQARVRLAVDRRHRRLRAEVQPGPAHLRHDQGHVLRAALRGAPGDPGRALHLAVHAPARQGQGQADGRDHGRAARASCSASSPGSGWRRGSSATSCPVLLMLVAAAALRHRRACCSGTACRARCASRLQPGMEVALIVPLLRPGRARRLRRSAPRCERGALRRRLPALAQAALGPASTTSATASWSGIAMGFAVIPIIFTIAEDAFSNVPQHLTAGLAGARREPLADGDRASCCPPRARASSRRS